MIRTGPPGRAVHRDPGDHQGDAGQFPGAGNLDRAASQDPATAQLLGTRLRLTSDESFEFGLDCLLDGIAARLAARS